MTEVNKKGEAAKAASYVLAGVTTEEKDTALRFIADQLITDQSTILVENQRDIQQGKEKGLSDRKSVV